jgi:hypothetical protein
MTRLERNANIVAVVVPFLGLIGAAVVLWHRLFDGRDLALERVGLAWDVVRVSPERAREKLRSGTVTA